MLSLNSLVYMFPHINRLIRHTWRSLVSCRVRDIATTKKGVKIIDFKPFYKHFIFVDKGNFDIKKVLKRYIDVNVFVDIVCVSEK